MHKLLTISKNTFIETIRQPIFAIIIGLTLFLMALSPSLAMYTMGEDNKLLREICLSTLFLASLFVAIFSASGALSEELDNKTVLTVLTKPVRRSVFILAKFFGVSGAVLLAHFIGTAGLLMVVRHGAMETASDQMDFTVVILGGASVLLSLGLAGFFNYVYDWKFTSTAVSILSFLFLVSIGFLSFINKQWQFAPQDNGIILLDVYASVLLFLAALIIVAIAIAFSTRFNILVTLAGCFGIFLLGLISDYSFGRFADVYLWAQIGRYVIPNMQVFWISDAIYEGSEVPLRYIMISAGHAISYIGGMLFLAMSLFQRRQVG